MKRFLLVAICGVFSLANSGFADDVFWMTLRPRYSYQDMDLSCSDKSNPLRNIYVMIQTDANDNVVRAQFQDDSTDPMSQIRFSNEERASIKVARDAIGDGWIQSLPLSTRLVAWAIYNMDSFGPSLLGCRPPQQLINIAPGSVTYEFVQKEANAYFSQVKTFEGQRADGKYYTIKMGFNQTLITAP